MPHVPARIDRAAVARLAEERLDWRFRSVSTELFGLTVAEALATRPGLFSGGFLGPMVVLDAEALRHNLITMAQWCAAKGIALAPHGKTTMAPQLFARQLDHGAWAITCATAGHLRMYRAFGVSRVLMANQLVDPAALRWLATELDRDPSFEFSCWADSVAGVELMARELHGERPVDVLVELGGDGGRTGARGVAAALEVAEAVAAQPALRLAGVGGYEAALANDATPPSLSTVDQYLADTRQLTREIAARGLFDGLDEVIVTVGGSAYFDQVADALTAPLDGIPVLPVLRSGAYLTHDDGLYRDLSPLGAHPRIADTTPLRPALHAWAQVTSRPSVELALLTAGRRDLSFDQGMPQPQQLRADGTVRELTGCQITALNDQHAFLAVPSEAALSVGDWVRLGLSHPCTVFDKWPLIPELGPDGETVIDLIRTWF